MAAFIIFIIVASFGIAIIVGNFNPYHIETRKIELSPYTEYEIRDYWVAGFLIIFALSLAFATTIYLLARDC